MKSLKLSFFASAFLLPLFLQAGKPFTSPLTAEANIQGNSFNPQILGVKMRLAETNNENSGYYVSTDHKLYGNSIDADVGSTFNTNPEIKAPNYLFRVHDYIAVLQNELIEDIEVSFSYRFIVTKSGKVFAVGFNGQGQLGTGNTTQVNKPTEITSNFGDLGSDKVIKIAAPSYAVSYTFALTEQGKVFGFGTGFYGAHASTTTTSTTPVEMTSMFAGYNPLQDKIIHLDVNLALTANGVVYGWGASSPAPSIIFESSNITNPANNEKVVSAISTGTGVILLTSEGRLFAKGTNQFLELGDSDTSLVYNTFTELNLSSFSFLSASNKITFITSGYALTTLGNVIAWGTNKNGTAGTGSNLDNSVPFTNVTTSVNTNLRQGEYFVYAYKSGNASDRATATLITNLGVVFGLGNRSTLGFPLDGNNAYIRVPRAVGPEKVTFTVDPLGGPEVGSFSWAYGYSIFFSNIINSNPPILNTIRPGYIFGGLFFDQALTQNVADQFSYTATESITLYPKWFPVTYNAYYQVAGANVAMTHNNPQQLTGAMIPYTLLPATATGRTFIGWYKDVQLTQAITVINFADFSNNTIFLYAKFEAATSSSQTPSSQTPSSTTPSSTPTTSQTPSSSTTVSSTPTTSQTPSSSTTVSSTPTTSTPASSIDGGDDTPNSPIVPILLVSAAVGGAGVGGWFFIAKGASIGGFSYVALKKWLVGFFKRDRKDKGK